MKYYEKNYEDVYTSERSLKRCRLDKVTTLDLNLLEYRDAYRAFFRKMSDDTFYSIVCYYWLRRHFGVSGSYLTGTRERHAQKNTIHSGFIKHQVGVDQRVFSRWFMVGRITSYLDLFFPDLISHNPFSSPDYFRFPFTHVTIDFLAFVYQMEEKLELLAVAEEKKMAIGQFMDYVINYALSYNDDYGVKKYSIMDPMSKCTPYIKNMTLPANLPREKKKIKQKLWKK